MNEKSSISATIKTNKGDINLVLFDKAAPLTVANFVNLSKRGFYDGLIFHRVIKNFMIQGGCPQSLGTGGPGYKFADEFVDYLKHDKPGILSMANSGPKTNGSQFFITHIPTEWLDMKHTIFGEVKAPSDQEVVDKIEKDDVIQSITIHGDSSELSTAMSNDLASWNTVLDDTFTRLKAAN